MFSLLDSINHFLGYFNINPKVKNQIYTILGIFGNFYILHLAIKFFKAHAFARGFIFVLIFLVLLYFCILNFLFYFTKRTVKWDVSPFVEKKLSKLDPHQQEITAETQTNNSSQLITVNQIGKHAVIYDQSLDFDPQTQGQLLEANSRLLIDSSQTIQQLLEILFSPESGLAIYDGLSAKEIKEKTYKIGNKLLIPSAGIIYEESKSYLTVGINAFERIKVAEITKVGNISINSITQKYEITPVSVILSGGKYKVPGRTELITGEDPYEFKIKMLCKPKI